MRPCFQIKKEREGLGYNLAAECQLSMCEALGSVRKGEASEEATRWLLLLKSPVLCRQGRSVNGLWSSVRRLQLVSQGEVSLA